MSELPVFSKVEADQILKRAAEIEGADDGRRLTLDELRSIAGEAGFGPRAVERAIAEAHEATTADDRRPPVRASGMLMTHLSTVRVLPLEISSEQLMRAVRLLQPYREGPPQLKLEEHQVTWRDRKGLRFTVVSGRGGTEIHVLLSRVIVRKGRWIAWVKAAADRLETLIYMIAAREAPNGEAEPRELPAGRGSQ